MTNHPRSRGVSWNAMMCEQTVDHMLIEGQMDLLEKDFLGEVHPLTLVRLMSALNFLQIDEINRELERHGLRITLLKGEQI